MKAIILSAVAAVLATGAYAQSEDETYQELYERGGFMELSNVETNLARLLRANGVPDECLGQLTFADAGTMHLILNDGGLSDQDKRGQIREILVEKCQ
jgi:hypothetical protein